MCLYAAANVGVAPIDTLFADFRDTEGLERDCRRARRDGFTARIAIHPNQVATINRCFSPSEEELAEARRIVAAFTANPNAGAVGIDGKMVDIPHLKAARRTLASAGDFSITVSRPLPGEEDLEAIREGVRAVCAQFGDDYWLERDNGGEFPREFHRAMAEGGWLGIIMRRNMAGPAWG